MRSHDPDDPKGSPPADPAGRSRLGFRRGRPSEKGRLVKEHFDAVAPHYDRMNTILSFGLHRLWKRAAVKALAPEAGEKVLDLCGGTGDLALLAAPLVAPGGLVVLADINRSMMDRGLARIAASPHGGRITHAQADAERLPFPDGSFDAAMVGFGVRNLASHERGFREMHRVLRAGGRMACLEFSMPVNPVFRALYNFYSFAVMPLAGSLLAGSRTAYTYLPESIRAFPGPSELALLLERIGFGDVRWRRLTNGIAVVHTGVRSVTGSASASREDP